MNRSALGVMVRVPEPGTVAPGTVKTRLVPPLTHEEAVNLYCAFLRDTFKSLSSLREKDIHILYTPVNKKEQLVELIELAPDGAVLTPQKGCDLGERLKNAFKTLFKKGYQGVCIIGSDSPDLPLELIDEAFLTLTHGQNPEGVVPEGVVLGPTEDGGYYLIGMDRPLDVLFTDIPWSTERVLTETIKRAEEAGIRVSTLKKWHDIDTPADLELLRDNDGAPESSEFLKRTGFHD